MTRWGLLALGVAWAVALWTLTPPRYSSPPAAFADPVEHLYCLELLSGRWTPAEVERASYGHVVPAASPCSPWWTVAMVHNHPRGERCYYVFPGTYVQTSDAAAAAASRYPWDGIWCKDHIVWRRQ